MCALSGSAPEKGVRSEGIGGASETLVWRIDSPPLKLPLRALVRKLLENKLTLNNSDGVAEISMLCSRR